MCRDDEYRLAQAQVVVFEMASKRALTWEQREKLSAALSTLAELQHGVMPSRSPAF